MTDPDMEGVDISKIAARWFGSNWRGDSFMAVGMKDVLITPALMERMHQILAIKRPALMLPEVGHFVQEHGAKVARAALAAWAD
jgi:haloalkane dehalogenase